MLLNYSRMSRCRLHDMTASLSVCNAGLGVEDRGKRTSPYDAVMQSPLLRHASPFLQHWLVDTLALHGIQLSGLVEVSVLSGQKHLPACASTPLRYCKNESMSKKSIMRSGLACEPWNSITLMMLDALRTWSGNSNFGP